MKEIYINLKRFEVPRALGGLCPMDQPIEWIEMVLRQTVEVGLGTIEDLQLVYLLPESLIPPALSVRNQYPTSKSKQIEIGCQGVHWDDIQPGKNFGAFTSSLPATSAKSLGCIWAMVGHSEERKAKQQIIKAYESTFESDPKLRSKASHAVDQLVGAELACALEAGLHVLLCVGESAEERGEGEFSEQKPRVEAILKDQLLTNLKSIAGYRGDRKIVIGYEPIWAIGPGKTPPGAGYISFVSAYIKKVIRENFDRELNVVYGGGLKKENAGMIAGIQTIDGGLVALTQFTGQIGFEVEGLRGIVNKYLA